MRDVFGGDPLMKPRPLSECPAVAWVEECEDGVAVIGANGAVVVPDEGSDGQMIAAILKAGREVA